MKKLTTMLTAFIMLVSATAFSAEKDIVSEKIKTAFEKTFINASDVKWKKLHEFYLADFRINEQNASAAFNENGELISAARNITMDQVPLAVTLNLQNRFSGYTLANVLTELTTDGITSYFIKAQNAKRILTIKASAFGDISVEKKTKKKQL